MTSEQSPTPLFDRIQGPADLKKLDVKDLPALAAELRHVILDTVSVTGGHLGSGMGVVELTIALHYVFDFAVDRLVFDVGHQVYPHKLLTERKHLFHTLRQKGGLSGFANRFESRYDTYLMGHAGTATSCALGISAGDRLRGSRRHVVSLVGDASMGAGVAFEALNFAGSLERDRTLVILNDNSWSIAKTVGALSRYLDRLRSGPVYNQAKKRLHTLLQRIPLIGRDLDEKFDHLIDHVRKIVVPGQIFEELGLHYFGPIDGHDIAEIIGYLERTKDLDGPVLLHVRTKKGHGVPGSQERYDRAHAAKPAADGPKPIEGPGAHSEPTVVLPRLPEVRQDRRAWTAWFGEAVEELAAADERVVALTAAMPDGTGLMGFAERFPDRFVDAGIAEQHCVAYASGLATAGARPVAAIYSTFLQRAYDQVFQEVALQNVPVVFAMDRAGLVGEDGATHNGLYDIAYLRALPNMTLCAPKDGPELKAMLRFLLALDGPSAIRYPRGSAAGEGQLRGFQRDSAAIELGKMEVVREGADGAILAYGHMVETALEVAEVLAQKGIAIEVVNARFVKPLDADGILALCDRHDRVITLEDHAAMGGFGSAVLELLAARGPSRAHLELAAVPDRFLEHASRAQVLRDVGLDTYSIAARFLAPRPASV